MKTAISIPDDVSIVNMSQLITLDKSLVELLQ